MKDQKKRSSTLNKLDKMVGYMFPVLKHSKICACRRGIYLSNSSEWNISLLFEICIPQRTLHFCVGPTD